MNQNFIEELRWRGMLHDMMPGTEERLNKGMVKGYIGFDPTADSLGVGNLVQVMTLLHFQKAGHKPIALVGGATGMVGDPSGKSAERNLLDETALQHNLACQRKQLERFLDFNCGENAAEIVNNYDWFKGFTFLEFIRDVGKHITVNYMMSKDSVKKRLEGETGMSFTEFSYQLVQGYDFYYLWKNQKVELQMGGSDQWGNIVTGTEFIRRKSEGEGKAYALTTPLIKKADGTKFGKTESGNIWLDPKRTSPYQFYQFWLNASDADVSNYIRIFSLSDRATIEALTVEHQEAPHLRLLQKSLAKELTIRVHSEADYEAVLVVTELLFGNKASKEALESLSTNDLAIVAAEIPCFEISNAELSAGIGILDLLSEKANVMPSKSEVRNAIKNNAISINKTKITKPETIITTDYLLKEKYMMVENGKKNKVMLVLV
jgi:tyrosyl-tRNA synthetase